MRVLEIFEAYHIFQEETRKWKLVFFLYYDFYVLILTLERFGAGILPGLLVSTVKVLQLIMQSRERKCLKVSLGMCLELTGLGPKVPPFSTDLVHSWLCIEQQSFRFMC